MIENLTRLIGSGLLLDGFDAFLAEWFPDQEVKTRNVSSLVDDDINYENLPYDVRRYFEILNGKLQSLTYAEAPDPWENEVNLYSQC